jgi:hypothetical protein
MQQGKIRAHRKKIVLTLTLALGVGLPPPAQAYVLDFTVVSIKPGVLIAHAGGYPSRPPPVGSRLKAVDVKHKGDPGSQSSPAIAPPDRILNFPSEPWADPFSDVPSLALGIPRQTADDNFNPGFAASFSSVPQAFAGTRVPSGNILHRITPFSSTLMLLGSGLVGLAGLRYRRRRG